MRIGIIGNPKRALTWEKHLRALATIKEVIIMSGLNETDSLDACILLDDSENRYSNLEKLVRDGIHTYLISKTPDRVDKLEKIYYAQQEAGMKIQYSHWPSLAPSTLWLKQQIKKPVSVQIFRDDNHNDLSASSMAFKDHWFDELGFITNWMGGRYHNFDLTYTKLKNKPAGIELFIRFASGSTASLHYSCYGKEKRHKRIISDGNIILDCNVLTQDVFIFKNEDGVTVSSQKSFEASNTAELSLIHFIKAIQVNSDTLFTTYTALETSRLAGKIEKQLG